jgi:dTDP-4-amino-4,6-dideoxygalactose transaminase
VINATFAAGARPVLAEIDERTSNIDASKVEDLITERTKSIVVQHMYALPADIDPLRRLAEGYDLVLIEDCAQSLGARYKGARIGSIGVFGFASVGQKIITVYGPGGILFTHSKDLARRVSCLRDQGHVREENISFIRSRADDWYGMSVPGFQFHMPEAMSAIGRMQVPMIDKWNSQRRKNAALYTAILGDASLPVQLPVEPEWATPAYLHYVIKVDGRDKLRDHLSAAGIETKRIYPIPIHFQPPVKKVTGYKAGDFPVAERDAARVLALPVGIHMTEEMITYVAEEVIRFYK